MAHGALPSGMAHGACPSKAKSATFFALRYGALRMPVELMGGVHDGVISALNVREHYKALKVAGVQVGWEGGAWHQGGGVGWGVCVGWGGG